MRLTPSSAWCDEMIELFLLEPEHVNATYVSWLNDPVTNRYLESRHMTHDEESVRGFIAACLASPDTLFLGIRQRETSHHVGNIKLEINRLHNRAEVGILIGDQQVRGRGIGMRAIKRVVEISRTQLGLRRLTAGCYAGNKGSERAFVKAGFSLEGTRPDFFILEGQAEALTLMARAL